MWLRRQLLTVRSAVLLVHLSVAIVAGLFVVVTTVSGAAIVFRREIDQTLYPGLYRATAGSMPLTDVARVVGSAYPDYEIDSLYLPDVAGGVYEVRLEGPTEALIATVDPGTGRLLGSRSVSDSPTERLADLHVSLARGPAGRTATGWIGIALLTLLFTGIYLWWPGVKRWALGFRVRSGRSWRLLVQDTHKLIGAVAFPILLVITVTGVALVFPDQAQAIWYAVTFDRRPDPPNVRGMLRSSPPPTAPLSLDEIVARALAEVPGGRVSYVIPPYSPVAPARVTLQQGYAPGRYGQHSLWLDQYSGEVLGRIDPRRETTASYIFRVWTVPLHYGGFGRLPTRLVWLAAGLAPLTLLVSGLGLWLIRQLTPHRRRRVAPDPRALAAARIGPVRDGAGGAGERAD